MDTGKLTLKKPNCHNTSLSPRMTVSRFEAKLVLLRVGDHLACDGVDRFCQ